MNWYESTFRSIKNVVLTHQKLSIPATAETASVLSELQKRSEEARGYLDQSFIYAERKTLLDLRELFVELESTRNLAGGPKVETADLQRKKAAIMDVYNRIAYELATSIRDQLHLDKIKREDRR